MKEISVQQIVSEQTWFDKRFSGKVAEGLLMKLDGTVHIQTSDKKTIPLERTNIVWVEMPADLNRTKKC